MLRNWGFNWSLLFLTTFIMPWRQAVIIIFMPKLKFSRKKNSFCYWSKDSSSSKSFQKRQKTLEFHKDLWRINTSRFAVLRYQFLLQLLSNLNDCPSVHPFQLKDLSQLLQCSFWFDQWWIESFWATSRRLVPLSHFQSL